MSEGLTRDQAVEIIRARPGRGDGKQSYGQRLTARKNGMLATGRHPATSLPLRADEHCGTCVHAVGHRRTKTYYKCDLVALSFGPLTDIRLSWPACTKWEPRPEGDE
jgi:hypothetical protein